MRGDQNYAFDDRFPTQPIAVGGLALDDRPTRAPAAANRRWILVAVAMILAPIIGVLGYQSWTAAPFSGPFSDRHGAVGVADGVVPDGVTVFDDVPAVANLDPALLKALRRAATNAAGDRVVFYVNSGWRSRAYQDQLLHDAVAQYGSEQEAARWVATADTSQHVSGHAIDIGHADAAAWLSEHGAAYGLCQIYRNEPWHFERRPAAATTGCPSMYADPTHDPRMQQ